MSVTYPFDPTGLADSNIVVDELHTLTEVNAQPYRILIPEFAPFYLGNFQIKHVDVGGETRLLNEDLDYTLCLPYIGATRSIGQMLYGGITINDNIINGVLKVTYRTLGGDWTADRGLVLAALAEYVYNPRITVWDIVTNKPTMFPPINHDQSLDYVYGHQDLIAAINDVASQIASGPSSTTPVIQHLLDTNNPHETNAAQVGLGNVANLPLATDEEVDSLAQVDKYFTLRQLTLLGIIGVDANLLGVHVGDTGNPHHVNKAQVGLGLVENLELASDQEVSNAQLVEKYITLRQAVIAIQNAIAAEMRSSDINRAEMMYYAASTHRRKT